MCSIRRRFARATSSEAMRRVDPTAAQVGVGPSPTKASLHVREVCLCPSLTLQRAAPCAALFTLRWPQETGATWYPLGRRGVSLPTEPGQPGPLPGAKGGRPPYSETGLAAVSAGGLSSLSRLAPAGQRSFG